MAATPDMWSEKAKVSIALEQASGVVTHNDVLFDTITETVDIDIGDKDFDVIATIKGGRLVKYTPQEVTSMTLEAYPLEGGTSSSTEAAEGTGFFDLVNTHDATQPLALSVDHNRDRYRMAVMWTNDTGATVYAHAATNATFKALRVVGCGFFISAKPAFTDGALKFTVVLKCPPFKKDATANVKIDSSDGSGSIVVPALAVFTTAVNW